VRRRRIEESRPRGHDTGRPRRGDDPRVVEPILEQAHERDDDTGDDHGGRDHPVPELR
jgi:hypothetical protein